MQNALETLGIRPTGNMPLEILLSESFNGSLYGMEDDQMRRVQALRDIVMTYNSSAPTPTQVTGSKDAVNIMYHRLYALGHEEVWVAFFNTANRLINTEKVFSGSLAEVTLCPRDILARALSCSASSLILYHNHPSGNVQPSKEDIRQTELLQKACETLQVSLLDHIVISKGRYFSFADNGESTIK